MDQVFLAIAIQLCIYVIVIAGLNLVSGYAGVFSVSQGLAFGIGAFSYAGLVRFFGVAEMIAAIPLAAVVATLFGVVIGRASLRVSGDHFIIASFGAQIVGLQILYNWRELSGGGPGAFGLPSPTLLGVVINEPPIWLLVSVTAAGAVLAVHAWLARSPFGVALRAMRDDPDALQAGGVEPVPLTLGAFIVGGISAAIAGVLFAGYVTVAQVADYTITISISLLCAVIAGGAGTIRGSIFGVLLFVGIPRALDLLEVPTGIAGVAQQLVFGVLLVLVVLALPQGLAGIRLPRRERAVSK